MTFSQLDQITEDAIKNRQKTSTYCETSPWWTPSRSQSSICHRDAYAT